MTNRSPQPGDRCLVLFIDAWVDAVVVRAPYCLATGVWREKPLVTVDRGRGAFNTLLSCVRLLARQLDLFEEESCT